MAKKRGKKYQDALKKVDSKKEYAVKELPMKRYSSIATALKTLNRLLNLKVGILSLQAVIV